MLRAAFAWVLLLCGGVVATAQAQGPAQQDSLVAESLAVPVQEPVQQDSLPADSPVAPAQVPVVADSVVAESLSVPAREPVHQDSLSRGSLAVPAVPKSDSTQLPGGSTPIGGDRLGACLVTLPDQNSDGVADVAVGASGSDRSGANAGAVLILAGHSGDTLRVLEGERPGDAFGASLAALTDLDGDGVADLAVGATNWDSDSATGNDAGKVYVYSGASGNLLFAVPGSQRNARLGQSLAGLGDTNGDGRADLAAGQIRWGSDSAFGAGRACVLILSGADGTLLHRIESPQLNDRFGSALCSAGDLDLDGACDLLAGAYRDSHGSLLSAGAVYVISGRSGSTLKVIQGTEIFEQFGYAVAGGGDTDGDGLPDFAVGARFLDFEGGRRGRVYLYSGKDFSQIGSFAGSLPGQQFGSALRFTSDLDGDRHADLVVGAAGRGSRDSVTEGVYVLSSRSGSELLSVSGEKTGDGFGGALDGAPDLDGDGHPDLFAGAAHSADAGTYAGKCYALSGRSGTALWTRVGRSSLQRTEAETQAAPLMSLEQLREEVKGYDFPVFDTTEVDAAPIIRRSVAAVYPTSALEAGPSGWVKVKVLVLPDGSGAECEVVDDAGLGPDFREAAVAAAREWSFLAASRGGVEVACWAVFPIGFAPPLAPEEQRRIDSLAAVSDSSLLTVDSLATGVPPAPADSALSGAAFYELDQVDTKPVLAARVEPDYPGAALISGDTCTVHLRLLVNGEGAVADVAMGEVSVRGKGFETAAVAAVRKWRYEPAIKDGNKVAVWVPEVIVLSPPGTGTN